MAVNLTLRIARSIGNLLLLAPVYWDGFRADPQAFLTAAKWWLLRKRVRARGQFAPLLSQSTHAYRFWAYREQQRQHPCSLPSISPPIVAIMKKGADDASNATRESVIAEGLDILVISDTGPDQLETAIGAIDWKSGPWLMAMEAGDLLAPGAAAAYRAAMTKTHAHVLYGDDDLLCRQQRRTRPHFKPDWNRELYDHFDYLTGACILHTDRMALAAVIGNADWAARLVAQAVSAGGAYHVRRMLHHRVSRPPLPAAVRPLEIATELPLVSIIIPTRDRLDLLRTCLEGVANTDYPDVEVIIVDNDSEDPTTIAFLDALPSSSGASRSFRVLRHPGPFNYSEINNRAIGEAGGELICLLNNDIEIRSADWLAVMATQALREDVGAVGAMLLYPDGRIQHAGVVIGVGNAAGHAHRFLKPEQEGYFRRHALPQFVSAVTAACLVVKRERLLAVGGLDEANFPVAFNDVDLCMRLNARGWQSLYEPRAVLVHHESVSRGFDRDPVGAARFAGELAALQRLHDTDRIVDPYHHPEFSRAAEQFVLAL